MKHEEIVQYLIDNVDDFIEQYTIFQPPFEVVVPFKLPNGLQADLGVLNIDKKICVLIEVKPGEGDNCTIGEFVRGYGQAYQYQKALEEKIIPTIDKSKTFLITSISAKEKIDFNSLYLPKEFELIFINKDHNIYEKFLADYHRRQADWMIISPYYIRDVRFSSLYFLLRFLLKIQSETPFSVVNARDVEKYLASSGAPRFPGDRRNSFIVLSQLGFTSKGNILTHKGYRMARKNFTDFSRELTYNYFAPQITFILRALEEIANDEGYKKDNIELSSWNDIRKKIIEMNKGKFVLYLCDEDGGTRYISSWMLILKEDLGALEYESSRKVKLNYFPLKNLPFKMNEFVSHPLDDIKKWFEKEGIPFDL